MNPLQEQLLKAGLVDEKRLRKAKKAQHKRIKRQGSTQVCDADAQTTQRAMAQKVQRDRELNRRRKEQAEGKAIQAQIRQLIHQHRLAHGRDDLGYHFEDRKKIRTVYVSEAIHRQLARGHLAIVRLDGRYEIVPTAIADKVHARDERCVILCHSPGQRTEGDDPYADHPIPDDLMW